MKVHRQLAVFGALLAANALLALLAYVLFPVGPWAPARQVPTELVRLSLWQLGLTNAGIVIVLYGLLGHSTRQQDRLVRTFPESVLALRVDLITLSVFPV